MDAGPWDDQPSSFSSTDPATELDMKPNIEMNEYTEDDIINISDRTFENSPLKDGPENRSWRYTEGFEISYTATVADRIVTGYPTT
jgi:hypothetical protein